MNLVAHEKVTVIGLPRVAGDDADVFHGWVRPIGYGSGWGWSDETTQILGMLSAHLEGIRWERGWTDGQALIAACLLSF